MTTAAVPERPRVLYYVVPREPVRLCPCCETPFVHESAAGDMTCTAGHVWHDHPRDIKAMTMTASDARALRADKASRFQCQYCADDATAAPTDSGK